MPGYALSLSATVEGNNNIFTFRWMHANQTGHTKTQPGGGFFDPFPEKAKYNDNFWDIGIYYGRNLVLSETICLKLSFGPVYYKYLDKKLDPYSGIYYKDPYRVITDEYGGVGISSVVGTYFAVGKQCSLGFEAFLNINKKRSVTGLTFNIMFIKVS